MQKREKHINGLVSQGMAHLRNWLKWYCFLAFLLDFAIFTGASIFQLFLISRL
jgi:hypothetical protein